MQTVLVFLFLVFLILLIVAIIKPQKFKTTKKGALLRFGAPALVFFIAIGVVGGSDAEEPALAEPKNEPEEVVEEEEEAEEELESEPDPLEPIDVARNVVEDTLKESALVDIEVNNYPENDSKVVLLTLNGSDNLTKNMIYKGMLIDSTDLAEAFKGSELEIHDLMMSWQMPLVDSYGNEEDGEVLRINLSGESLEKINFDNFLFEDIPNIADSYWEHPLFSN